MTAKALVVKVNINPRELVSVPEGMLGKMGDPIPDWAWQTIGLSVPTKASDEKN